MSASPAPGIAQMLFLQPLLNSIQLRWCWGSPLLPQDVPPDSSSIAASSHSLRTQVNCVSQKPLCNQKEHQIALRPRTEKEPSARLIQPPETVSK